MHYDFCEVVPGSISGIVYVDPNQNDQFDAGELRCAASPCNCSMRKARSWPRPLRTLTVPTSSATWPLAPTPCANCSPPATSTAASRRAPTAATTRQDDLIRSVAIGAGENLTQYNFSEIPPSSLSGIVYVSPGGCLVNPDTPIAGVTIQLLDAQGNHLGTTTTNSQGYYQFTGLRPGEYLVREQQPAGYFQGGQCAGSGGGNDSVADQIDQILITPGQGLVRYDFYETPPATISGYVFQDGPAIQTIDGQLPGHLASLRDGLRTADDKPIAGVTLELRNGITGLPILGQHMLPGAYPSGPVTTVTDANGYYAFAGLKPGSYAVYEVHPSAYHDGIDTPGSTSGVPFNLGHQPEGFISPFHEGLIGILAEPPRDDAIVRIQVEGGQTSVENNFSEVLVTRLLVPPPPERPVPPDLAPYQLVTPPPVPLPPTYFDLPTLVPDFQSLGSASVMNMSWHLSVVNGGSPRSLNPGVESVDGVWRTVSHLNQSQWISVPIQQGNWSLPPEAQVVQISGGTISLGMAGAIPISGDFNGDGVAELGIYHQGQWFIDLNGNGVWDEEDLWAQLGTVEDLPVVGDWDGDGKDDIGIFGPQWKGDPRAIQAEPGLPDPQNEYRRSTGPVGQRAQEPAAGSPRGDRWRPSAETYRHRPATSGRDRPRVPLRQRCRSARCR